MIYKRSKGGNYEYNFRFSIRKADGTTESYRVRQSARTKNRQDALDVEGEHRRALRLGMIHPLDPWPKPEAPKPVAIVMREFAKRFSRHVAVATKKGTSRFYLGCIERLLCFKRIADAPLDAITTELASEYADHRMDVAENEIATVNGDLRTLRRLLNLAVEWKELTYAPPIHEVPGSNGRDYVLNWVTEAKYLGAASQNLRDAAVILLDTGLRPQSELFVLEWQNVELTARPETPNGVIHIRGGKSEAAKRSVPLTIRAADLLRRRKMEADALAEDERSVYVFPGDGNTGHLVSLQHPHKDAIEKAKVDWFAVYSLRHTFGTRCAESGMDKYTLARLMGHSSPNITARYYVHVTEPHVTAGFEKFAAYQERGVAAGIAKAFPEASAAVQ